MKRLAIVILLGLASGACADARPTATETETLSLTIVGPSHFTGDVDQEVGPLTVYLETIQGKKTVPAQGVVVNFVVTRGGGTMYAGVGVTDSNGLASDHWTLGSEPGENALEVRAVSGDGTKIVYGGFTATASIPNRAPILGTISAEAPDAATTATCEAMGFTDPDGDELIFEWEWRLNGSLLASETGGGAVSTLEPQGWKAGDQLECRGRASDGELSSEWAIQVMEVLNAPPVLESIAFGFSPSPPLTLRCEASGKDPDGDTFVYRFDVYHEPYPEPFWSWQASATEPFFEVTPDPPPAHGDHLRCVVDASDGIDRSDPLEESLVIDLEGPTGGIESLTPSTATPGQMLQLRGFFEDTTGNVMSDLLSASYSVGGGSFHPMAAEDGSFDHYWEFVTASFSAPDTAGTYDVCAVGKDVWGNQSAPHCTVLTVSAPESEG